MFVFCCCFICTDLWEIFLDQWIFARYKKWILYFNMPWIRMSCSLTNSSKESCERVARVVTVCAQDRGGVRE